MMHFCTIICRNYLAQARVLGESLMRTHPDSRFWVLVIDRPGSIQDLEAAESFDIISLEDLAIPSIDVMKGIYSAVEFSTAVKPWLLEHLLARIGPDEAVVYLDPDIEVFSPMVELRDALESSWIVLTPHLTTPNEIDGRTPSEQAILLAGTYNLGFVAVRHSRETPRFLAWWKQRLRRTCVVDPAAGFFVDQRYIDFVPGLFDDVGVLRHEGYNIAYWNAATRFVEENSGGTFVNGVPIRFFHYSGYSPLRPERFSTHQDRIVLAERGDLASLVARYSSALLAQGYEQFAGIPYPFDRSASGGTVGPRTRSLYRAFVDRGFSESLFSEHGEQAFVEASMFNSPRFPHLTEAQAHLWESDLGVQSSFPDVTGDDATRLVEWFLVANHVSDAFGSVLSRTPGSAPQLHAPGRRVKPRVLGGVNVVGYLQAPIGVGEIARSIIRSLDVAGIQSSPIALHPPGLLDSVPFPSFPPSYGFAFPQSIMCVNADMLPSVFDELWETPASDLYTTGVWWWELDEVPSHATKALPLVDELLVGSEFIANALRREARVPVSVFPVPVSLGEPSDLSGFEFPGGGRWPRGFTFYFSFDCNSVVERKNPRGVVQAFLDAFPRSGEASLVIKSLNGQRAQAAFAELRGLADGRDDVVFIDGDVPQHVRDSMVAMADCYISLHRSEGMGLTMAEAMYAGKPVIATGYSGNLDFMTPDNSVLVDYEMVAVGGGAEPYPASAQWADPDIEQASRAMRRVFEDPVYAGALGRRAAASIRSTNSLQRASAAIVDCLSFNG